MPIIGPFPANITAGQPVSAAPVMADLNWIASQVNANAAPVSGTLHSRVMVRCNAGNNMASTVPMTVGIVATGPTVVLDSLSEFDTATGLFTAKNAGSYQFSVAVTLVRAGATLTAFNPRIQLSANGSPCAEIGLTCINDAGTAFMIASSFATVSLALGGTLSATATVAFSAGGPVQFGLANLSIIGLGA
jgi:hypothetical protein